MKMNVTYKIEPSAIHAVLDNERVGHVFVPDIDLHWSDHVYIKVAGIAGVGTSESCRMRGIAKEMMRRANELAIEKGYACSAVSTNIQNVARRLYSTTGYVTVNRPGWFQKAIPTRATRRRRRDKQPLIRSYREGDEVAMLRIMRNAYKSFFGWRRKTVRRWRKIHKDHSAIRVAELDGSIIGWTASFKHWVGFVSELYLDPSMAKHQAAQCLLKETEEFVRASGFRHASFWVSPEDISIASLLHLNGYRFTEQRVFKINILDLCALLSAISPILSRRVACAAWRGVVCINTSAQKAFLRISDSVSVEERGRPDVELITTRETLVRVLCGALGVWDAYLEGSLSIRPRHRSSIISLLTRLFPSVKCFHPADDLW